MKPKFKAGDIVRENRTNRTYKIINGWSFYGSEFFYLIDTGILIPCEFVEPSNKIDAICTKVNFIQQIYYRIKRWIGI